MVPQSHLLEATLRLSGATPHLPGLARIARFATATALAGSWRGWLARWLGHPELASIPPAPIAALTVPAKQLAMAQSVWLAQPLHLLASVHGVHLPPQGLLRLSETEQLELARTFATSFAESGLGLIPLPTGAFLLTAPSLPGEVHTSDPTECAGATLGAALPQGPDAGSLRRIATEIEMWLHAHPLNAARERAGALSISALWLWGGGPPYDARPHRGHAAERLVLSDDPYVQGLARLVGASVRPLPESLQAGEASSAHMLAQLQVADARAGHDPRQLAAALERLDREWVTPAVAAVTRGELGELLLVSEHNALSLTTHSGLKLWRRARAPLHALQ
jgi:hypothetical protein